MKRGLVLEPQQWKWSSYRDYAQGQSGPVLVNEKKAAVMKVTGEPPNSCVEIGPDEINPTL